MAVAAVVIGEEETAFWVWSICNKLQELPMCVVIKVQHELTKRQWLWHCQRPSPCLRCSGAGGLLGSAPPSDCFIPSPVLRSARGLGETEPWGIQLSMDFFLGNTADDRIRSHQSADRIRSHQFKLSLPDPALACGSLKIGRPLLVKVTRVRVFSSVDDCVFHQQGEPWRAHEKTRTFQGVLICTDTLQISLTYGYLQISSTVCFFVCFFWFLFLQTFLLVLFFG